MHCNRHFVSSVVYAWPFGCRRHTLSGAAASGSSNSKVSASNVTLHLPYWPQSLNMSYAVQHFVLWMLKMFFMFLTFLIKNAFINIFNFLKVFLFSIGQI